MFISAFAPKTKALEFKKQIYSVIRYFDKKSPEIYVIAVKVIFFLTDKPSLNYLFHFQISLQKSNGNFSSFLIRKHLMCESNRYVRSLYQSSFLPLTLLNSRKNYVANLWLKLMVMLSHFLIKKKASSVALVEIYFCYNKFSGKKISNIC